MNSDVSHLHLGSPSGQLRHGVLHNSVFYLKDTGVKYVESIFYFTIFQMIKQSY
jgi:hypothetical protein